MFWKKIGQALSCTLDVTTHYILELQGGYRGLKVKLFHKLEKYSTKKHGLVSTALMLGRVKERQ